MFGVISNPQHAAPSAGPGCVQKEPGYTPNSAFISTWPRGGSAEVSWRFALLVKLIHDIASSCDQQPCLRSIGWGRVIPVSEAVASLQHDAIQRGVICLRKMVSAVWGMTQPWNPGSCSFSSLPRTTNPRFSSSISRPLSPTSAGAQGK